MSYTTTAIEHRGDRATSPPPSLASEQRLVTSTDRRARYAADRAVDQILADSFPASDSPSWTLGVARPASPGRTGRVGFSDEAAVEVSAREPAAATGDVIDVSVPRTKGTRLQGLVSRRSAAGIAMLVTVAVLLIVLPLARVARGVADAIGWLVARIAG